MELLVLTTGPETIATYYVQHRMEKEAQIVEVLRLPVPIEFKSLEAHDTDEQQQQHHPRGGYGIWLGIFTNPIRRICGYLLPEAFIYI